MISYIKGKTILKKEKFIIVETSSGLGYKIKTSNKLIKNINLNEEVSLFIYSHIREDAFDLFGFENIENLEFFETIISVKGIGPKIGLEILNFDTSLIKKAIIEKNSSIISQIPGIGKKSAERIILELKEKINIENISEDLDTNFSNEEQEEIIHALINLGYDRKKVINGLSKIPKEIKSEEEKIKYFLQNRV
jgi:holliday junction DNA helicase RuvA